jgi:hypothetical protein
VSDGCVGSGVAVSVAAGVIRMRYGSRVSNITNGAAVGNPPGAHAGRRSYERWVAEGTALSPLPAVLSGDGNKGVLVVPG